MARILGLATLIAMLWGGVEGRAQQSALETYVTRRGDQLYDGERQLRFVSFNIPNLLVIEDSFDFLGASPWRWPNEFEIADALESVRQMGGKVVRSYVISVRRAGSDMGDHVHVVGPGEFNEAAFATIDRVLKIANEKQIRLIIPLVDNWKWMGGIGQYAAFRGKREQDFWTDRQLIEDFKATVKHIVSRRNTLTGQLYRDDKALLGWETGNELDAPPEWTAEIAAYLKQLDPNHLVIDGRSLHGVSAASLDDPNVDVVTTHHYPSPGIDVVERVNAAAAEARSRKPYFVGEVGFISLDETRRVLHAVVENNAAGVLYWSLRFHRREGGFYWHSETTADRQIKAFHWPGFSSGEAYDERKILELLVESAARIVKGNRPSKAPPEAATLLPIEHPGLISWQGATGAAAYNVERAESASGPWTLVAENVDDAGTQYRPLYCDASVEAGRSYFYRVTAANSAGAAPASNIVGPVVVKHALLVDEMNDHDRLHAVEGPVRLRTTNSRPVQEDAHRMEIRPGGSLTYELSGAVHEAAVWIFAASERPAIEISASRDGAEFVPMRSEISSAPTAAGDYGYLRPTLLRAHIELPSARFLRVANASGPPPAPDARPTEGEGAANAFEISRIEISYGRP